MRLMFNREAPVEDLMGHDVREQLCFTSRFDSESAIDPSCIFACTTNAAYVNRCLAHANANACSWAI